MEVVNEMKSGKAPWLNGFLVECFRMAQCFIMAVLECLVRLLNISFDMGVAPLDWRFASVLLRN